MTEAVMSIVAAKTDAQIAAELRADLATAAAQVIAVVERAKTAGLCITFNIGPDNYGRTSLKDVAVVKPL